MVVQQVTFSILPLQKSYSMPIGLDLQKRYATTVLDLEQLNKDLNKVLHEVQQFCFEVRVFLTSLALQMFSSGFLCNILDTKHAFTLL